MLTQCPGCQTTFRVTSEILRVADGQVRCGRCHTQFDAMARLIEEEASIGAAAGARPGEPAPPPLRRAEMEVDEPESHEEITLEGKHIEITGTYLMLDQPDGKPHLRQEVTEEWVEIDDIDSDAASDESIDVDALEVAEDLDLAGLDDRDDLSDVAAGAPKQTIYAERQRSYTQDEEATEFDLLPAARRRTAHSIVWKILTLPLALLLVAQVVHHYRSELARHPRLGASIMSTYAAVGLTLTPDWDLHAYEVRYWPVVQDTTAPGTLKVRASITNEAKFPQPYPLLKLVLEDRWGDQVSAREFEPAEYLDPTTAPDRLLAPAQQTNANIAIVDPGADAEGFRFDVCLRGRDAVVCSEEVPEARL